MGELVKTCSFCDLKEVMSDLKGSLVLPPPSSATLTLLPFLTSPLDFPRPDPLNPLNEQKKV